MQQELYWKRLGQNLRKEALKFKRQESNVKLKFDA
jgi:hypothetical protein